MPAAAPGPADDGPGRDPGLARERTDLAWTRTAVSFAALGAVLLGSSPVAGALVLASAGAVWLLGQLSTRAGQPADRRRLDQAHALLLVTVATTLLSLVAVALVLLVPRHR